MKSIVFINILSSILLTTSFGVAQDSIAIAGQISSWCNYNPGNKLPLWINGRYIPKLNYSRQLQDKKLIDFEASANIYGNLGLHPFDTSFASGKIKPYRAWVRYSADRFEFRLGLQKINFGSANILRPLMWFDQIDPRDPLKLSDGVWAALTRFYFLNNANLWLWGLYGNQNLKGWELAKTNQKYPEAGGRFQFPAPKGELALSYHFRIAKSGDSSALIPSYTEIAENRIGIDGKWDLSVVGFWLEAAWINNNKNIQRITNQEFITLGIDYTVGIGNGINLIFENLVAAYNEKTFSFTHPVCFSGFSASYPLGILDNIGIITYYDWKNEGIYNFVNWQRQFDKFSLYLMAYWNPKNYLMPIRGGTENLYSGKGIQLMLVFNH